MHAACMQRILKQAEIRKCRRLAFAASSTMHWIQSIECLRKQRITVQPLAALAIPPTPALQESCFKSSVVNSSPWPSKWMCLKIFNRLRDQNHSRVGLSRRSLSFHRPKQLLVYTGFQQPKKGHTSAQEFRTSAENLSGILWLHKWQHLKCQVAIC